MENISWFNSVIILLSLLSLLSFIIFVALFISIIIYPRGINFRFVTDQRYVETILSYGKVARLVTELKNKGYSFLGAFSERNLFGSINSLTFASGQFKSFVFIRKQGEKVYYAFFSPFASGELLLTANGYFPKIRKRDCIIESISGADFNTLFALHIKRLQSLESLGAIAFNSFNQDTRIDAARLFYSKIYVRWWMCESLLKSLLRGAFIITVIPVSVVMLYFILSTVDLRSPKQQFGWETFSSAEGAFSVLMPHPPLEENVEGKHIYTSNDTYFTYIVSYMEYPPEESYPESSTLLNEFKNSILAKGGTLVFEQDIVLDNYPGREFRIRESDETIPSVVEGRVYLVGDRVYTFYVRYSMPSGLSKEIKSYLDSFKLLDIATATK
jgi:hypothetical protein